MADDAACGMPAISLHAAHQQPGRTRTVAASGPAPEADTFLREFAACASTPRARWTNFSPGLRLASGLV